MSRRSSTASSGAGSRLLHLDAFSGIAGNMLLGALLDLGLPRSALESDLRGLGVPFRLQVKRVRRGAIDAAYVDVLVPGRPAAARARRRRAVAAHRDDPLHHDHAPHETHAHDHDGGRSWKEIRALLGRAKLAAPVRDRALAIFEGLAASEARVHGLPIDRVHFHEVGAVDAIVDVAGAAIGLHRLGIARVTCSPLPLGHGTVGTAHGTLPLPAPATLELLRGVPVVPAGIAWETVTPTGAAIVRGVVDEFCMLPAMRVEAIGHGAGNDRSGGLPNVLRALVGREEAFAGDRVAVLETHVDDLNPEHFDYVMERLLEAGALDVALMHLQMKKNRPGFAIRVVARPADRAALAAILFAESTTLGVRVAEMDRVVLARTTETVRTRFGAIRVKLARDATGHVVPSAEYDDCKRAARRTGAPLRDVVRAAEEAARTIHTEPASPRTRSTRGSKRPRRANARPR
jgi:pyridinium-3,5-bisthiocarboxylic acid mononucleotide nickel chelatase